MKFEELQSKIAGAKSPAEAAAVIAEYNKTKKDEAAAIQAAIAKEAVELAGAREALAVKILGQVNKQSVVDQLNAVKAQGFKYHLADETSEIAYLGLLVPIVKAKKAGATGGTHGAARDLNAIFEANATAAEREELVKAQATDVSASEKLGRTTNSNAWRVKDKVAKRVGA